MNLNIITEACDKKFHLLRTSLYSFISKNQWFDGKVYLLTHPNLPFSNANFSLLTRIYENIELVDITKLLNYIDPPKIYKARSNYEDLLYLSLKIYSFSFSDSPLLYFSNFCCFSKNILELLNLDKFNINNDYSIILIQPNKLIFDELFKNYSFPLNLQDILTPLIENNLNKFTEYQIINSIQIEDIKFSRSINLLGYSYAIIFDSLSSNNKKYFKINQIWFQLNTMGLKKISSATGPIKNIIENTSILPKINNSPIKINEPNKNLLINKNEIFDYLNGKKIAIIANSSELLNHKYGELIDSHDIIIRFNGYSIIPEHTGSKTNIHCIFREARFNLDKPSDFLLVFSKPLIPWKNAVNELLVKYPSKKIVDYNFPTDLQIRGAFNKNIIPTSGLCLILLIESLNIPKYQLSLFGFNGYKDGPSSILRSNNSNAISKVHNYPLELKYLYDNFTEVSPYILQKNKNI